MAATVEAYEFLPKFRKATVEDYVATLPNRAHKGAPTPDYAASHVLARHAASLAGGEGGGGEGPAAPVPRGFAGTDAAGCAVVAAAAAEGDETAEAAAVCVSGAGEPRANGVYRASAAGRRECGAPVYEHTDPASTCALLRRGQESRKTGKTKHGWLLIDKAAGQQQRALYGVQAESLVVPTEGWKRFDAPEPLPHIRRGPLAALLLEEAERSVREAARAWSTDDLPLALSLARSGLRSLDLSGLRFGPRLEVLAPELLTLRAAATLELGDGARDALRDSASALGLGQGRGGAGAGTGGEVDPTTLPQPRDIAERALRELLGRGGDVDEDAVQRLLKEADSGGILDLAAPLSLGAVERWIDRSLKHLSADDKC